MAESNLTNKPNQKLICVLSFVIVAMFGFGFAMVPLYNAFCKVTGINGKTAGRYQIDYSLEVDTSRTIKIQFITSLSQGIPWEFKPTTKTVDIHPGEIKQVSFYVKNFSDRPIIGRAIPSISPGIVASHMHKTECFCFNEQLLQPGESKFLPLMFFLGKEFPKGYSEMTLSYTLFDTKKSPSIEEIQTILNI